MDTLDYNRIFYINKDMAVNPKGHPVGAFNEVYPTHFIKRQYKQLINLNPRVIEDPVMFFRNEDAHYFYTTPLNNLRRIENKKLG